MIKLAAALVTTAVLTLSACGTTDPAADETGPVAETRAPITVTDGRGEEVTIDAPAERVVTLEWSSTEDVITLGVQPVGVADIDGYESWVTSAPLTDDPVDVGTRTEPSLESVAAADPDLILGITDSVPDGAMDQMEKIAPVVLLTGADASDPLGTMRENFTTTATLLGEEDAAEQVLSDLDTTIEDSAAQIEAAGMSGTPFNFSYIYEEGNNFSLRMHGPGSQPIALATAVGLTPAWQKAGDSAWGLSTLDLEGLTRLPPDTFFTYWANEGVDDPTAALEGNALWESLPFVEDDMVAAAAEGVWVYGGPASSIQWVNQVAELSAG